MMLSTISSVTKMRILLMAIACVSLVAAMITDDEDSGPSTLGAPSQNNRSFKVGTTINLVVTCVTVTWAVWMGPVLTVVEKAPGTRHSKACTMENEIDCFAQIPKSGTAWLKWVVDRVIGEVRNIRMSQKLASRMLSAMHKLGRAVYLPFVVTQEYYEYKEDGSAFVVDKNGVSQPVIAKVNGRILGCEGDEIESQQFGTTTPNAFHVNVLTDHDGFAVESPSGPKACILGHLNIIHNEVSNILFYLLSIYCIILDLQLYGLEVTAANVMADSKWQKMTPQEVNGQLQTELVTPNLTASASRQRSFGTCWSSWQVRRSRRARS